MKILLVTREFPPTVVGGIGRLSFYTYKYLRTLGVDVKVVAFGNDSDSSDDVFFFKPSSSITMRRDDPLFGTLRIPLDIAKFTCFVNKLAEIEKYDIVHVLEPYVGGFIKHEHKVTTIHDTAYREFKAWSKYPLSQSFKRLVFYLSIGYIMEIANIYTSQAVIAPSIGTAATLRTVYRVPVTKIRVVPNGIEPPNKILDQRLAKKMLGLDSDIVLIFTTAHHVARKRLETLIEALKNLKNWSVQGYKVVIGGEGPLTDYYKALTHKYGLDKFIKFTGWLHDDELHAYYSACDIFVITSESEAGPITLLEAAIRGKAIITTDIDGLPAFMKHGLHCLKFGVGDSKTLAQHLKKLISNKELRIKLGLNANKIAKQFTWDRVIKRVVKIYKEVLY
ncbi:hypothetical protein DRO64_05510 [Candidatus Bathyarchaeota archaeon]|nr:MAG: hypothetical protein DRO64_05510 [Candidatus Bathyarchaeota archaeon]